MISTAEIHRRATREGLRFDQIEKDYAILWILYGLSQPELDPGGWIFKGGTCLRHCYYYAYRFSDDMDFTCLPSSGDLVKQKELLERLCIWVFRSSGIRLELLEPQRASADFQIEIPIEYSRGGSRKHGLPQVKIHVTSDEPLLTAAAQRNVQPPYSDLFAFSVVSYSKEEILAEKLRALLQQQLKWPRPRDLYDLWFILCHRGEQYAWERLVELFAKKCEVRAVAADFSMLASEELRRACENTWEDRLGETMPSVPSFGKVWLDWEQFLGQRRLQDQR